MSQTSSEGSSSDSKSEEQTSLAITRACDMCRKKKIRCEPTLEACLRCIKYKTPCHFTPIPLKRKSRRRVGDMRVEKLEKRLEWMEAQLQRNLKDQQIEQDVESKETPRTDITPTSERSPPGNIPHARFAEHASLVTATDEQTTISPWVLASDSSVFKGRAFKPLPPKDEALEYIRKSFQGFNSAMPIFDLATFLHIFESPDTNITEPAWWACLNVVLALTHRFGATSTLDREGDREAWGYFQNAFAVSGQLAAMRPTLASIQALLAMSIAILGTPYQGPGYMLVSSAVKLAQLMGLHRQCEGLGLAPFEMEQRKRVFWVAYCLDKELSLQLGQPPTQDDDEMDVDLPFMAENSPSLPGELDQVDFFHFRVRLAIIQGQIYKRLCSVKASKQSVAERVLAARDLEVMIKSWRTGVLTYFDLDLTECRSNFNSPFADPIFPGIVLQLSYFKCLSSIYDVLPTLPRYREIQDSDDPWRGQVQSLSSEVSFVGEARKALKLIFATPQRHNACMWAIHHIFVSATTTLLSHVMANPSNPSSRTDLNLIEPILILLNVLANSGKNEEVNEMHRSCVQMFEEASVAVEHASRSWHRYETTEPRERESVEDFLRRIESISGGYDDGLSWAGDMHGGF